MLAKILALKHLRVWDWVKAVFYVVAVVALPHLQQQYAAQMSPDTTQALQALIALLAYHDVGSADAQKKAVEEKK